jgi:hypothetical protein
MLDPDPEKMNTDPQPWGQHSLSGEGEPIRTTGEKAWHPVYSQYNMTYISPKRKFSYLRFRQNLRNDMTFWQIFA